MREATLSEEIEKLEKKDFTIKTKPKDEYVLRVNNMDDNTPQIKPHQNINPNNLPALVKGPLLSGEAKKCIVFALLFLSTFSVSVYFGYTVLLLLFR